MIDFTTCIATDAHYLPLLRLTWQTWQRHRPELFRQPLLVLSAVDERELAFVKSSHPNVRIADIPPLDGVPMRERVFTAFIQLAPWLVETKWFFKLDVDTVARRADSGWCDDRLTDGNPVFIASPWNYTKPADAVVKLDKWADGVPELARHPALNLPFDPAAGRVITRGRVASYTYFGRTDWHRWLSGLCRTLPLPSQDTLTWYVARRTGAVWKHCKMKRFGWSFCRHRTLAAEVKSIMEAAA